jgi:hypothetical protein
MDVEVNHPLGDEVGDPWDHPSFISTVDAICHNHVNNSLFNASPNAPSTLQSTSYPSSSTIPNISILPDTFRSSLQGNTEGFGISLRARERIWRSQQGRCVRYLS